MPMDTDRHDTPRTAADGRRPNLTAQTASALVQRPTLSRDEVRAASTAGLAFGAFCFGAVWLLTPLICGLFHQPALSPVLRVLALSFLPEGWSMTGIGLLRREHRFRELSIIMAGTYVLGFLVVGV